MQMIEQDISAGELPRPKMLSILAMLMAAAGVFSWLIAYAFFDALVAAELISRSGATDPRPRWLIGIFSTLMIGFAMVSLLLRCSSRRHLARIDQIGEEDAAGETATPFPAHRRGRPPDLRG